MIKIETRRRLTSKFFFAPINTGFVCDGAPTDRLIRFHRLRSSPNIGISYVGNVAVSPESKSNSRTPILTVGAEQWKMLSSSIRSAGSRPGIQIACRLFPESARKRWSSPKSSVLLKKYRQFILDLDESFIERVMNQFILSVRRALTYGFDVIQIHAAHGYFLSLLASENVNFRKDKFSVGNRGGLLNLIQSVRELDDQFLLDVRLSCLEGLGRADREWGETKSLIRELTPLGVDMVSLSAGMYDFSKQLIYPSKRDGFLTYYPYASEVATELPGILFNVAGNVWNLDQLPEQQENLTFGIGRPLIADPKFVGKYAEGRSETINHCGRHGQCHYYTRGKSSISCKVNDDI